MFYKISLKEAFKIRRDIFKKEGNPALETIGFHKSPFKGIWFGFYPGHNLYEFEFCRITKTNNIEFLWVSILREDRFIFVSFEAYHLSQNIDYKRLKNIDEFEFGRPINRVKNIELLSQGKELQLKRLFITKRFANRFIKKFSLKVGLVFNNIEDRIEHWYQTHELETIHPNSDVCIKL